MGLYGQYMEKEGESTQEETDAQLATRKELNFSEVF